MVLELKHYFAWLNLHNFKAKVKRDARKQKHCEQMQAVQAEAAAIRAQRETEKKAADMTRALVQEASDRMLQNAKEEAERSKALLDNVFSGPISEMKALFTAISSAQSEPGKNLLSTLKHHELAVTQYPAWTVDNTLVLVTHVVHLPTAQSMRSIFPMNTSEDFVFLKEYALAGIFALHAETRLTSRMKTILEQGVQKRQETTVVTPAKPVALADARFQQKPHQQPQSMPRRQAVNQ